MTSLMPRLTGSGVGYLMGLAHDLFDRDGWDEDAMPRVVGGCKEDRERWRYVVYDRSGYEMGWIDWKTLLKKRG